MQRRVLPLVPALLAAALYLPALRFAFVWDDWALVPLPVYASPDWRAIFTSAANGVHWLPVRDLTLVFDTWLFDARAVGFHGTNVLLFVVAVALATRLYRELFAAAPDARISAQAGSLAAACGLVFAVHPLQVEPVAFVSSRGGLLALVFGLASLLAHAAFAERGGRARWGASLVFSAAALASKQSAVTLPVLLLLVHLYRAQGVALSRAALAVVPHAALALASAAVHAAVARSAGVVASLGSPLELVERVPRALFAAQFYVWKFLWPVDLTIEYDVAGMLRQRALLVASSVGALLLFAKLVGEGRRRRTLGWLLALCYAAALLPVSNLLPTTPLVADRYAQLPLVALVPLVVAPLLSRLPAWARLAAAALAVGALALATARQVPVWRDDQTLFAHAIRVNPKASAALGNLGLSLWDRGRTEDALRVLEDLHDLAPRDFRYPYVRGLLAAREGRLDEAERWLEQAAAGEGEPAYVAHMKLGDLYLRRERRDAARRAYERALELSASFPLAAEHQYAIRRQLALLGAPTAPR